MYTVLAFTDELLWEKITFHIFGEKLTSLARYVDFTHLGDASPRLVVYRNACDIVIKERTVHSEHKKLEKPEVYIRFYIPQIIELKVEKYLYLDTDTVILQDVYSLYHRIGLHDWVMAAGMQSTATCTLGKMLDLHDLRLQAVGIKMDDVCMSGGAFFVNRTRWVAEERTAKWEYWIRENTKQKLYYLGCMPPQMIVFHKQWQQLTQDVIMDMKGRECCAENSFATVLPGILHPVKDLLHSEYITEKSFNKKTLLTKALIWT